MPLPPAPNKKATRIDDAYMASAPKAAAPKPLKLRTVDTRPARTGPAVAALMAPPPVVKNKTNTNTDTDTDKATMDGPASGTSRHTPAATRSANKPQPQSARPATTTPAVKQPNAGKNEKSSQTRGTKSRKLGAKRLFVLDTNVLMHDPLCLFRFEEHDVFLPMIVLEELDNNKKGMSEVARNARQTSRTLDGLAALAGDITAGLALDALGHSNATGKLFFQTIPLASRLPDSLPQGKADNQILGVVQALSERENGKEVVLVSKDINMRVKARALGLAAEDYENDKTLDDGELLYPGVLALPTDFWIKQSKRVESWQEGSYTFYRVSGAIVQQFYINQFVYFEAVGEPSLYARVTEIRDKTAVLKTLRDFSNQKNAVWGVMSRNREQNFALNLLMDPDIDFITLTGTAGTGKTLLALASGLTQVLDERRYTEIIMTRATVSVGEDIGFLPGTEEEKMGPWMGALDDNLEFLAKGDGTGSGAGEWGRAATNELIRSRIKVKSLNFMRGRTFMNKFVIIDEAQNLTPKQMKTLITRAGPGTKMICMGNLAQIDTPYLTEGSSGLTFVVDRFKGWANGGHITLARGERSRLADFASDVL